MAKLEKLTFAYLGYTGNVAHATESIWVGIVENETYDYYRS